VTRGGDGAYAVTGGTIQGAVEPVDVVDTIGVGGAFTAGVLAAFVDCRAAKLRSELAASVRRMRGPSR